MFLTCVIDMAVSTLNEKSQNNLLKRSSGQGFLIFFSYFKSAVIIELINVKDNSEMKYDKENDPYEKKNIYRYT